MEYNAVKWGIIIIIVELHNKPIFEHNVQVLSLKSVLKRFHAISSHLHPF